LRLVSFMTFKLFIISASYYSKPVEFEDEFF